MKFAEYARKLEVIKYLAGHKKTGNPRFLAKKLEVSERTVQRMIQHLRNSGCPVVFNRFRGTYEVDTSEGFANK